MENSNEEWRDIPGYEGLYMVSDTGRVKSLPKSIKDPNGRVRNYKERIMKQQTVGGYGHLKVGLYYNSKCKEYLVHRLVLLAFNRSPFEGEECLHKNGIPSDNRLENLRWGTSKENSGDCIRHKTIARGNKLPQTKLCEKQVLEIRGSRKTPAELSKVYGVHPRHIRAIKSRTVWSYLEEIV